MADIAGKGPLPDQANRRNLSLVLGRFRREDRFFFHLTRSAVFAMLALLLAIVASLAVGSWPALGSFGLDLFISQPWSARTEQVGALAAIYGTMVTSAIAMLIAVPVGIGIAVFLTEVCPHALRGPIGGAIELLAGIPSIVFGIWGFFVFAPLMQQTVQPFLISLLAPVPVLNVLFAGPPYGLGVLTAGLILAIMVVPFIAAVSRDVFATVPVVMKEAAYGLGCTTWEVVRSIVMPHARAGLVGGVMLALVRALGETMAVAFVIGNVWQISAAILQPGTTLSAAIALEYADASGGLYRSSLVVLGLILFAISFIVLAAARLMLVRLGRQGG